MRGGENQKEGERPVGLGPQEQWEQEKRGMWHLLWDSYQGPPCRRGPRARSGAGIRQVDGWERHLGQTGL